MWLQFILQNTHFALNLYIALVFFAVFWLYFDAWMVHKKMEGSFKIIGFLLLSLSFVLEAAHVESFIFSLNNGTNEVFVVLGGIFRVSGYLFVLISLFQEKLEPKPALNGFFPMTSLISGATLQLLAPILAILSTLLYARKAYLGLEAHLRPLVFGFLFLSLSQCLATATLLRDTKNIQIYMLVAPFGPIWILEHIMLFCCAVVVGKWVFGYLLKQFFPQLFFVLNGLILVIFLATTVTFTGLLLHNLQDEVARQLESDAKILQFSIDAKLGEYKSDSALIASDSRISTAILAKDRKALGDLAEKYLVTKKYGSLIILDSVGQVLARGENTENIGEAKGSDLLTKRALHGENDASIVAKDGVISKELFVVASAPIFSEGKIIGALILEMGIDNGFVDGIKSATGLETSIYGGDTFAATTLLSSDQKTRYLGIKENNPEVRRAIFGEGKGMGASVMIGNAPYMMYFLPLKDIEQTPLGMISVGRTESGVLQAAGRSIALTFVVALALLTISIIPSFMLAKYISDQV